MRTRYVGDLGKVAFFGLLYFASVAVLSAQGMMKGSSPAAAPASQATVTGTIGRMSGATIFVTASDGSVSPVEIRSDTLILGRQKAGLDSIQAGEALGVAATKAEDGSLTATAINVFTPELWKIVRKGQFPMANGQVMTNAQVESLSAGGSGGQSSSQDAGGAGAAAGAAGGQSRTIYLKYEMLTAAVEVPDSAEIRRSVAMRLSDLKPGQKVTVRGSPGSGGSITAALISVDLPG